MDASNIMKMLTPIDRGSAPSWLSVSPRDEDLQYDTSYAKRQESLVNNKFQSDVTFLVGEGRRPIYAHKLLLIMASEYFSAMFNGNFRESSSQEIAVSDVEPDIFLEIMRFIYCGRAHLRADNVLEICVHSQKYMLNALQRKSIRFLEKNIFTHNVLQFLAQNRLYNFSFIDEKCLTMIRKNPLRYFQFKDFLTLDWKSLEMIFASRRINCSDEQLYKALRDWNAVNESEYVSHLQTVISAKRSYNCAKLRFFGSMSTTCHSDLKFSIDHPNSLALFGIGVFVKSQARIITIEVVISENLEVLGRHRFDYENKDINSVNVASLFFERLTLDSEEWYTIAVKFDPNCEFFSIANPQIYHDKMKLFFDSNYNTLRTVVSHFYCDIKE